MARNKRRVAERQAAASWETFEFAVLRAGEGQKMDLSNKVVRSAMILCRIQYNVSVLLGFCPYKCKNPTQ